MSDGMDVFDERGCALGEGPLWLPERAQLLWFDITEGMLLVSNGSDRREWDLGENVSAAGLTADPDRVLVATESALVSFHLDTGAREEVCALEADRPETRSNDGRADPWGGFWIGTMGKGGERHLGAFHRWHGGELRTLHERASTPNATCFDRDRALAFFTDTPTRVVMRQPVHPDTGWPEGEAEPHIDLRDTPHKADGAVIDAEGNMWIAQWGSGRVACHDPEGRFLRAVEVPGRHSSCPAFGGPDLATLFCTTARQGIDDPDDAQGRTYRVEGAGRGRPEPQVSL